MVQLEILTGQQAGAKISVARFPFLAGRGAGCGLILEEPGMWERHFELRFEPARGILLVAFPDALISVNGKPVREQRLRNGDVLEIGALKIRFWLAQTRARSFRWRERLVWAGLAALVLWQIALIYWLGV